MDAALDLLRRLPPENTTENLVRLAELIPSCAPELLSTVDIPSSVQTCAISSRDYLCCDYNRHGNSYRSPWSNKFSEEADSTAERVEPSERLRKIEVLANDAFDTYRVQYYEGGLSSVYCWDVRGQPEGKATEDAFGFSAAILLKKTVDNGSWDAIHIVEVFPTNEKSIYSYKLTSSILLHLQAALESPGLLSGNLTRQMDQTNVGVGTDAGHVVHMGRMVEEMESRMRSALQEIYFGKTHDAINEVRIAVAPSGNIRLSADLQREMAGRLSSIASGSSVMTRSKLRQQ